MDCLREYLAGMRKCDVVDFKTRAALHRDVRAICSETCHFLGLEITKPAMEIVGELVFKKLLVYGTDLEAFAKHGKRSTINTDDVKLLVRRCPSLKNLLNAKASTTTLKEKRRKTVAPKVTATPASKQKESDILMSKQMETETPTKNNLENVTSKQDEPENFAPKPSDGNDNLDIDNMTIDDLIDLTFD